MEIYNNHKKLFSVALLFFVALTIVVAIMPAINNQNNNEPLPNAEPMSEDAKLGKLVFIAEGCVACHTQQVRNVDMDKVFGSRPSMASDYADAKRTDIWRNTATLMGTERTGPDLTNIGERQGSLTWNLLHLYQPRAVVEKSIMPAYPWLFIIKDSAEAGETEVVIPKKFRNGISGKIIATKEAMQLVAYLQSLKQTPLPKSISPAEFLYQRKMEEQNNPTPNSHTSTTVTGDSNAVANNTTARPVSVEGKKLYSQLCQSCHQENGEGIEGAFPPLKGSPIVEGDLKIYVNIIMKGYDARPEYGSMTAIGEQNKLTAKDVADIINFERSSWGNTGKIVTEAEIEKILKTIK